MSPRNSMRVVLHIGASKCGSSAIQAYLALNRDALADRGVIVPDTDLSLGGDVTGEQIWFIENSLRENGGRAISAAAQDLVSEAGRRGCETLVLSAENICNTPDLATLFAGAFEGCDVTVVFYVRRQDDFLISSWQQWNLKRFDSLEAFLHQRVGRDARWLAMISPWADAFGDAAIRVRPFARDRLFNRDVIDDFFHILNLSQDGLQPLRQKANPSFDDSLARLAHRARDVFDGPHDNRFYDTMAGLLGKSALKKGSASSLLDLDTRRDIYAAYADENAALVSRFLSDLDDPLFPPPAPSDVIEQSESERLSEELAMLTRAVYALATRLDRATS